MGAFEDLARRAVVFIENDSGAVGKGRGERDDVPDIRTPPRVNTLIVIPDDHQVVARCGQHRRQLHLDGVGILKFIDGDVFEPLLISGEYVGKTGEELQGEQQQIVKVNAMSFEHHRAVGGVDPAYLALFGFLVLE